jgi:adenosylhomocysteine nucleosidase
VRSTGAEAAIAKYDVEMPEQIAIVAALPREVAALVRGWPRQEIAPKVFVWTKDHVVVACAGMGTGRVTLAVQAAMSVGKVTMLISAGVAGGCDPALRVGDVVRAGVVVDTRTGERFSDSEYKQVVATVADVADVAEKRRLFEAYSASAVDMEAATVARLAQAHGLGFAVVKTISDASEFEMKELGLFGTADGQFRTAAFVAYVAMRPRLWGKLGQLAGNGGAAISALTKELESQIDWYRRRG